MKTRSKALTALLAVVTVASLASCTGHDKNVDKQAYKQVDETASQRQPYIPKNNVEFNNYNAAQQLYDDPTSIIWCTTTWGNANSPLITVPVAGKLTSSSVSYFPNNTVQGINSNDYVLEARSVDGMFHGSPPPYRYGFTPGGQYVDFFNMATFCTTALTSFQRQQTQLAITNDAAADALQKQAEDALKAGDKAKAQQILEGVTSGTK